MKNSIVLAILFLTSTVAPASGQHSVPASKELHTATTQPVVTCDQVCLSYRPVCPDTTHCQGFYDPHTSWPVVFVYGPVAQPRHCVGSAGTHLIPVPTVFSDSNAYGMVQRYGSVPSADSIVTSEKTPKLIGATQSNYGSITMRPEYEGEDKSGVFYMDAQGRIGYEVFVRPSDKRLVNCRGEVLDTSKATSAHGGNDLAIFVMDPAGRIYLSYRHEVGVLHHSSFLAGEPVAAAGEMRIEQGFIELLTNKSGHYRPRPSVNDQVLKELAARGVDVDGIKKNYIE